MYVRGSRRAVVLQRDFYLAGRRATGLELALRTVVAGRAHEMALTIGQVWSGLELALQTLVAGVEGGRVVVDQAEVQRIALSLPETIETGDPAGQFAFGIRNTGSKGKPKSFAWVWMERVQPKQPRVPNQDVLAVRVPNLDVKEMLLQSGEAAYFTEPHYNGFPAILVRLRDIDAEELAHLLTEAWCCLAPRTLVRAFEQRARAVAPSTSEAG